MGQRRDTSPGLENTPDLEQLLLKERHDESKKKSHVIIYYDLVIKIATEEIFLKCGQILVNTVNIC